MGKERLKELYGRGGDDVSIPVFRGQAVPTGSSVGRRQFVLIDCIQLVGAVVFQHGVVMAEELAQHVGVLLNDAGVRDDVHNAPQPIGQGVAQGEGHGGEGLATTRRYREGKQARGQCGRSQTVFQHLGPQGVDSAGVLAMGPGRHGLQAGEESRGQFRQGGPASPGLILCWIEEAFCVQKVRIHQTGIQHADKKGDGEGRRSRAHGQPAGLGDLESNILGCAAMHPAHEAIPQIRVTVVIAIWQATVMPGNAGGQELAGWSPLLPGPLCPTRSMVPAAAPALGVLVSQIVLKFRAAFAQVMQQARRFTPWPSLERLGKPARQLGGMLQVFVQGLPIGNRRSGP